VFEIEGSVFAAHALDAGQNPAAVIRVQLFRPHIISQVDLLRQAKDTAELRGNQQAVFRHDVLERTQPARLERQPQTQFTGLQLRWALRGRRGDGTR
jgi:hypothetical protein